MMSVKTRSISFLYSAQICQRIVAIHRLKHAVAVEDQRAGDKVAQVAFILDHEDGLGALRARNCVSAFSGSTAARCCAGKINMEGRALAQFALHLDPAVMLLDDAEDGGQAEAGAFAQFLGGEERLENARQVFRRDALPVSEWLRRTNLPGPRLGHAAACASSTSHGSRGW